MLVYAPLLPLIAWQGLMVRRRMLRLPEASGPRAGTRGGGVPLRLLVLGDSAAAGVGVARQDDALAGRLAEALAQGNRVDWHVLARTGWTAADALAALDALDQRRFDVVVTSLGVNDATAGHSAGRYARAMRALAARLRAQHGVARVICSGLPPMHRFPGLPQPLRGFLGTRARALDAALAALAAEDPGLVHLPWRGGLEAGDMAADGFHPGPRIYRAWAAAIAPLIAAHPRAAPPLAGTRRR